MDKITCLYCGKEIKGYDIKWFRKKGITKVWHIGCKTMTKGNKIVVTKKVKQNNRVLVH